ncbi:MAG: hypothetical protein KDA60_04360, partial [Planctomycetales bacterium]|nr:hypothetical protein [Planctomycetales bacterium]
MSSRTNMNRRRDRTNDDVDYEERPSRARTLALPILTLVGLACGIWFWQVNIGPEQSSTDSPATAGGELVAGEPIPNPAQYLRDLATRYGKLASYEEESSVEIRIPANGQMTS